MHILGIVGSMRKNRHTNALVNKVIADIKLLCPDATSDVIHIVDKNVSPCRVVCSNYCSGNPYQCLIQDDIKEIKDGMTAADALVIGTPLYFRAPPAKFQAFAERLISIFYYYETNGGDLESPLKGKPCGLVGVAEYSNPHQMLEYLHDFCTMLKMKPVVLDRFPYLGVAGQGDVSKDAIFKPFERSKDLARAIVREVQDRNRSMNADR